MPEVHSVRGATACYTAPSEELEQYSSSSSRPLNEVVSQLLSALSRNSDEYLMLQNKAMDVAQKFHESIFNQLEMAEIQDIKHTWREKVLSKISAAILPLALAVTGTVRMIASGDPSVLVAAATSVGTLWFLETALDEPAQRRLASLLGRGSDESTESWLGRLHVITSVAALGLSFGLGADTSVQIAVGASKLSVECMSTGVSWQRDRNHAHLTELSLALGENDRQIRVYGTEVRNLAEKYGEYCTKMQEILDSEKAACRQIFGS